MSQPDYLHFDNLSVFSIVLCRRGHRERGVYFIIYAKPSPLCD
jgi:hypothetical protein